MLILWLENGRLRQCRGPCRFQSRCRRFQHVVVIPLHCASLIANRELHCVCLAFSNSVVEMFSVTKQGHRGLGNASQSIRPVVYCTYARSADGKEFRDSVNFSRKRYHRIGDLVLKAPTREERARLRERTTEAQQMDRAIAASLAHGESVRPTSSGRSIG